MVAFLCCLLLPAVAIGYGVLLLVNGVYFNLSVIVPCVVIPLVAAGLLALCLFSNGKTLRKAILSGLVLVLFAISFVCGVFFGRFEKVAHYEGETAEHHYVTAQNKNTLMPTPDKVGQPADIEYHRIAASFCIFSSETDYLICRYAADDYALCKAALETDYTFQTEPIFLYRNGSYSRGCEPTAELDGYHFRLLSTETYKKAIDFPKEVMLIGYSDDAREIVYLSFEDIDLDYVSSLEEFIVNECGWKYVRNE